MAADGIRSVQVSRGMRDALEHLERVLRQSLGSLKATAAACGCSDEQVRAAADRQLAFLTVVTAIRHEWDRGGVPGGERPEGVYEYCPRCGRPRPALVDCGEWLRWECANARGCGWYVSYLKKIVKGVG